MNSNVDDWPMKNGRMWQNNPRERAENIGTILIQLVCIAIIFLFFI